MSEALKQARQAASLGEVPVGAVVVYDGEIISQAHNEVEQLNDASAHAELLALRRASTELKSWRLNKASLYASLEPCSMCVGAMILARVSSLYFAASDPRQGAVGSLYNLANQSNLPHQIEVYSGLLEEESCELLQKFFAEKR